MLRRRFSLLALVALALSVLPGWRSATASFGPPWITIEVPPNPYDRETRDAYLVVNAFHHFTAVSFPVTGTAEGLVESARRSIDLKFEKTSKEGRFTLAKQWPAEGTWMLVIKVTQAKDDDVTALVQIGSDGQVASVKVPTERRNDYTMPKKVSKAEIEGMLAARVASSR